MPEGKDKRSATAAFVAAVLLLTLFPSAAGAGGASTSAPGRTWPSARESGATPILIERALDRRDISRFRADLYLAYAFADPARVPQRFRSEVPWDGTLPLLGLRRRVTEMDRGAQRARLSDLLEAGTAATTCGSVSAPASSTTSSHFLIHSSASIGGGLNIDDYVTSLETSWTHQVDTFGWAAPPLHPNAGSKYHVIVTDLGSGLYGFVTDSGTYAGTNGNNPNTPWAETEATATCMALNDDYSGFPSTPQNSLDSTTAHEFNHSIQFGYGAFAGSNSPDEAFIEGGATWMEDEVFDGANDNYFYLWPDFDESMGSYSASPYPYWITFRGMTERYGTGTSGGGEEVMQDFWENVSKKTHSGLDAMDDALVNQGANLADAFHAYAIAVKFSRPCGGSYVLPYCFEEGENYVASAGVPSTDQHGGTIGSVGESFSGFVPDNYALSWVALPGGSTPYGVTLRNSSAGGQLRATIACDTGAQIQRSEMPAVVGPGGSTARASFDPTGCASVVAVITNQSQTEADPESSKARSFAVQTTIPSTDESPPSTPAMSSLDLFGTQNPIPISWTASSDPESGVESYVVQQSVAPPKQPLGPWQAFSSVISTSDKARARPGYTYCFRVAAINGAALTSEWSAERCTAMPLDDRALDASTGWSRDSGSAHYRQTITRSARRGAILKKNLSARSLALVATRCPGCGTVTVLFDGTLLKRVSLGASTTKNKSIIQLARFSTQRVGKLTIKIVSRGKSVLVDGLGTSAR